MGKPINCGWDKHAVLLIVCRATKEVWVQHRRSISRSISMPLPLVDELSLHGLFNIILYGLILVENPWQFGLVCTSPSLIVVCVGSIQVSRSLWSPPFDDNHVFFCQVNKVNVDWNGANSV